MDSLKLPDDSLSEFNTSLPQNHLDDSKLGAILSPNSGGASSPCTRGKTMREFEAELADLRQENFELKMKIYVLEEQKEALEDVRDFSELSKQLDKVKAELEEKEDLILKAGEAMTLMSKKHEEEISQIRAQAFQEVETYKTTISRLEQEIIELKEKSILAPKPTVFEDSSAMYAVAFNLPGARPKSGINCDRTSELESKILELEELLRAKSTEVIDLTAQSATLKLEADRLRSVEADLTLQLEYRVQKLSEALSNLTSAEKTIQELSNRLTEAEKSRKVTPTKSNSDLQLLQKQYSACKLENQKLHDQVLKLHQRITELEKYNAVDLHKKIDTLMKENGDLREKIRQTKHEKNKRSSSSSDAGEEKTDNKIKDLEAELTLLRSEVENLRSERVKSMKAMQAFVKQNRALTRDVERLQGGRPSERGDQGPDSNKREELELVHENEGEEKKKESDFDIDDPEKAYLYSALEAKRQQVDQLNEKLRKRTYDLQELVNKELWSKNKEIEKLNRVCEKQVRDWTEQRTKLKSQEAEIKTLNDEIDRLRKQLTDYESSSQSCPQETCQSTHCEHTNEFQKLKSELELQIAQNAELNSRCELLKQEAENSEKARKDLLNACSLLTTRLEELTSFLESLLPSLAGRRRRLVKEAIDMSREVSKSLSLSCLEESSIMCKSIEPILPDVSQVDFNSEEDLDDTLLPSSEAIEDQNNQVLNLRYEMENLVQRLKESSPEKKKTLKMSPLSPWSLSTTLQEQRDFSPQQPFDESMFGDCIPAIALEDITEGTGIESLETDTDNIPVELINKDTKRGSSIGFVQGSESEGWSEPDRTVSMARIGLKEESVIREVGSDSSDSPAKSNNSSGKRRRESEIKSLHMKIRSLEMTIENLVSEKSKENETSTHNVSVDCQLLGESNLTENLMTEIKNQREKLMLSLNHNDFIRQRLEEVLSSAPSSPTKSDSEKQKLYNQNLLQKVFMMTDKINESCSICFELKSRCLEIEKEKLSLMELLHVSEDKANALSTELNGLKCVLKEKENDLLEKQCSLLELKNNVIILESRVKISQEEAQNQARLLEALTLESNAKARELSEKWEKERADLISHYENEIAILKMKLKELEVDLQSALSNIEKMRNEKDIMEGEYKILLDKVECEKREVVDRESQKRVEAENRLADSLRAQRELRNQLDAEINKVTEIEAGQKLSERTWRRRVAVLETSGAETEARLRRKLDQLTLSNSEAVIERTRLANERLALQREHAHVKDELERRIQELQLANHELESRLCTITKSESAPASPRGDYKRQRSNPTSDYTSDHEHHSNWFPVCVRTNNNSSPDLGIESDNRMSSLEQPLSSPKPNGEGSTKPEKLELENSELRAQLARTRQALEETLAQLSSANQRKRQVEKAICRQLQKTHTILQKARLNLEPSEKQNV